jgi:hypothetical protein
LQRAGFVYFMVLSVDRILEMCPCNRQLRGKIYRPEKMKQPGYAFQPRTREILPFVKVQRSEAAPSRNYSP